MDKLERLLNLTLTLLETPRPLTANDIWERVPGYPENEPSFRRAFERDKDSLREMGIPIRRSEISHTDPPEHGYRIRAEDYYMKDPGFEPDELAAINLAASAVQLESANAREGLWKLEGVSSGAAAPQPVEATSTVALAGDPNLGPLFGAVAECAPVTFTYNERERTVDPYRLDYQRGRWYLTGFDHGRGEERNFRIDRIAGSVAVGAPGNFTRPTTAVPGGPAQPWEFGDGDPVIAQVLFDAETAPWARRHLGESSVVEEWPGGAVVASVEVTNWPAFRSFVLTFLDRAEILGPPELRASMIAWLSALAPGASGASDGPVPGATA